MEKRQNKVRLLPWIENGGYQNPKWQRRLNEKMAELRKGSKPGSIVWNMNNRTVI